MNIELDVSPVITAITRALEPLCDPLKSIDGANWSGKFRVMRGNGQNEGYAMLTFVGRGGLEVEFPIDMKKALTTDASDFIAGIIHDVVRCMDDALKRRQIVVPNANLWMGAI